MMKSDVCSLRLNKDHSAPFEEVWLSEEHYNSPVWTGLDRSATAVINTILQKSHFSSFGQFSWYYLVFRLYS